MTFQRDYGKYLVLKYDDINKYLSEAEWEEFRELLGRIWNGRKQDGKPYNTYVVVNEDEPYAELVWALIQMKEEAPERLEKLLSLAGRLRG